jgi:DNA-binding NarL/FixJ family response regulator
MIQVALVDDHQVTRRGIKPIIELDTNIKVTHEASTGKQLLEILDKGPLPDIVILDINMPEMNGFQTIRRLQEKFGSIKIVVFSLICEEDTIINMINNGASGYITKSADPDNLATAILAVHTRGFYLGDLVKREYFRTINGRNHRRGFHGTHYLTPKELEFIKLTPTNLGYKEIAELLSISPKTLEKHRDSIFARLDIKSRAALVLYGIKNGLINTF